MTPKTPITVGHVGWSPDYKSTPKLPATGKLIARRSATACSRFADTPETNAHLGSLANAPDDTAMWLEIGIPRRFERERDDAIVEATNAVNDIIVVRSQLEELRAAVRNFRDVQGRHHTEIACKRLFALLPENAIGEARREPSPPCQ
jgi:hypothetical protein